MLEARAKACEQQRHHVPNILAVDFYAKGDLFQVVDDLNEVGPPTDDTQLAAK